MAVGDQLFCIGDRVVARRNDRRRNIENGTLGQVSNIDPRSGAVVVVTDSGEERVLDAGYVSEHLEHAYALTGHGAHGATVEWSGVIGRPSDFTREWAYTSLSRARGRTCVYVYAEPTATQREREQYASPEPQRSSVEDLEVMRQAMRRRESEPVALQHLVRAEVPVQENAASGTTLAEARETNAHQPQPASERAASRSGAPKPVGWRGPPRNDHTGWRHGRIRAGRW
jgi:ATP-dependent exoDNAse (exonuclease V) alpha subunit